MRGYLVLLSLILMLCTATALSETEDCSDSRRDYAKALSELNKSSAVFQSRRRGSEEAAPVYTLVLFRTREGVREWGEHMPDILIAGPHGCYTAAYQDPLRAEQAMSYLKTFSNTIYAELDAGVYGCSTDDGQDISFHSHGASKMGFGPAVSWAKTVGTGSVLVAVIDSGVYPHPLLSGRLKKSGYDYVDGDEDASSDTYGHGTHVAGIIVDCTPELPVGLKAIRVLNGSGKGSVSNTTSAIFEAAEAGSDVINLSLISDTHSEALEDAVLYAVSCGCAVVISAGNSGDLCSRYCPVHLEENGFIVVGACTGTMEEPAEASFSNYGPSVDVFAFGSAIESCSLSGGFTTQTGTSQAAPHISALCAILKLLFPSLGGSQLEIRIKRLAGDGEVNVPDAALLRPQTLGLNTRHLTLSAGQTVKLLQAPPPVQSGLSMIWSCEDETVAEVENGQVLRCLAPGETILRGNGPANADVEVILTVVPADQVFRLPSQLRTLEDEALADTAVPVVVLPAGIQSFSASALNGSAAQTICYSGNDVSVLPEASSACWIVRNDRSLWALLEERKIAYVIDCSE